MSTPTASLPRLVFGVVLGILIAAGVLFGVYLVVSAQSERAAAEQAQQDAAVDSLLRELDRDLRARGEID